MTERKRLKVGATTRPQELGGAIAEYYKESTPIEIVAVGAGAVNQATKGLILARRYVSDAGIDLVFKPAFETLTIDGDEITAIKWFPVEI